jgi:periplasmic mercuric ion binding protein
MKTKILIFSLFFLSSLMMLKIPVFSQEKTKDTIKIQTSAVCGMCKDRIESGMAFEKGVQDVSLDAETKIATITYNARKTTPDLLRKAISKLGYDADSLAADPVAYKKLPACCKKDAPKH